MKKQRGIALILVLMITGMLGLLMLQVSLNAGEHVARAQRLSDRAEATLRAQSRETALLYTLLTRPWVESQPGAAPQDNPYAAAWNFRGEPFTVDDVTYRVQDTDGLLPLPQPSDGTRDFVALLRQLDVDASRAERLGEQLRALQGASAPLPLPGRTDQPTEGDETRLQDTTFPLQSMAELRFLDDMDEALLGRLERLTTLYPTPGFNPLTAPTNVLAVKVTGSVLAGLLQLRDGKQLDERALNAVAGISADDGTTLYPGPALRIEMQTQYAGIGVGRETTVVLRPYENEPVGIWSRRTLEGLGT